MRSIGFGFLLAAAVSLPFAQGGSAIVTLVLPPPGGDGYGALQAGGALARGSSSLYYNPALLTDLERSTGSQSSYSHSHQDLLPVFGLPDLYQDFWSAAAVAPDPVSGTDLAVGFFRNRTHFGLNEATDRAGTPIGSFDSYESVWGAGIALRLGMPVSIGGTVKFIDSHLIDGFPGSRAANGWAFDLGMVANPRLSAAGKLGLPAVVFTPSFALTARNLGPEIFYSEASQADPIPTTYSAAYGLDVDAFDLAEFEAGADMDHEWTRRSETWDQVRVLGYSISLLGFRYSVGWLDDPSGKRSERHSARSIEFNLRRLHRAVRRIARLDFTSAAATMEQGYPFAEANILGIPFRANPRIEMGIRDIESEDGGPRDGQESRYYLGLSL
ncbi:MAG: hypothetical protein JWO30_500 [Fibrobacteres bacterium]|nr:hypothetical protein [Fibrobacterota bacterium]